MDKKKIEIQTYLKERINPVMEPLTVALVKARPENIVSFCIDWFRKHGILRLSQAKPLRNRPLRWPNCQTRRTTWSTTLPSN